MTVVLVEVIVGITSKMVDHQLLLVLDGQQGMLCDFLFVVENGGHIVMVHGFFLEILIIIQIR
jgi:hypothetical protein